MMTTQVHVLGYRELNYSDVKYFSYLVGALEVGIQPQFRSTKRTEVLPRPRRSNKERSAGARLD
jgi:hypothetical protein